MELNDLKELQIQEDISQEKCNDEALRKMEETLDLVRCAKPDERCELARRYAIIITEFEKMIAYFQVYVTGDA